MCVSHYSNNYLDSVEIYNFDNLDWRVGSPLPRTLSAPGSAVVEGKLLVYGGNDVSYAYADIYEWDSGSDSWITRSEKMGQARTYFGYTLAGEASGVTCQ